MNSGRLGENVYGVWLNKEFVGDNGAKCIGSIGIHVGEQVVCRGQWYSMVEVYAG